MDDAFVLVDIGVRPVDERWWPSGRTRTLECTLSPIANYDLQLTGPLGARVLASPPPLVPGTPPPLPGPTQGPAPTPS